MPRDELHEEDLTTQGAGRPVDDQAERTRPAVGQGAGRAIGLEADLGRDAKTRLRVAADTPGRPFRAKKTATLVTSARRAMSAMVGRLIRFLSQPGAKKSAGAAHLPS